MQDSLFGESDSSKPIKKSSKQVEPAAHAAELIALAQTLPSHLRLGTSSWNYPGWAGMVWGREYPENNLSRYGLTAYSQHPLFKTVSIDRGFYRPMNVA